MWLRYQTDVPPAKARAAAEGERARRRSPSALFRLPFFSARSLRSSDRLLACVVALLLVLSQQAAFTHLISHLGDRDTSAQAIVAYEDRGHDSALSLTHSCATCVAIAALGGPPPAPFAPALAPAPAAFAFHALTPATPANLSLAYSARAPPSIL